MKIDINSLHETFKYSYETFGSSRRESKLVEELYNNEQYSYAQLTELANRGQPAETFNVIKLFGRLLVGYYAKVATNIDIKPRQEADATVAKLLNDIVKFTLEDNYFDSIGDRIKLDGILSGIMCASVEVRDTGKRDRFNRQINRIELDHVPAREILLDPMSRKEDRSDARFIMRFKWVSRDYLRRFLQEAGKDPTRIMNKLQSQNNHVNQPDTEYDVMHKDFVSFTKQHDTHLLVHTVITDDEDRTHSIFWVADEILSSEEVTYKEVKFPYRVQVLSNSNKIEYYGIFREVIATQQAINQALLKLQLMANSRMIFVENNAVENMAEFIRSANRVNAIIPVKSLKKIDIHNQTAEVAEQYTLIDKGFDRIQRLLGINDSFLGDAFASDSGAKVKLQQGATVNSLQFLTGRINEFYRFIGEDVANLAKQYYTAEDAIRIADDITGDRWAKLNQPIQMPTGRAKDDGTAETRLIMEEVYDPASGQPKIHEGKYVHAPLPTAESEIAFTDVDIKISSVSYNDEDDQNRQILDTIINSTAGQALLQANPAGYFKAVREAVLLTRSSKSLVLADIFAQTADSLSQQDTAGQQDVIANGAQATKPTQEKK